MLTQLQLEGPELEPLLVRVRNELGAQARIVHAEKIRSGGVAGFFAHQRFELTVEVDTAQPRVPAASARPAVAPAPAATAPAAVTPVADAPADAAAGPIAAAAPVPPVPGTPPSLVDLEQDRSLDLDAAAHSTVDGPPFSAVAGLQLGSGPDDTSLFSSLAALSDAAPAGAPTPARVPGPALAAASAYAPQAAGDALPRTGQADSAVLGAPAAVRPEPVEPAPSPSTSLAAQDRAAETGPPLTVSPAPAPAPVPAVGFAPHAAFASLLPDTPARTPAADPAASLLALADQVSADEHSAVVSTETPSFASVMSRLGDGLGGEPTAAPLVVEAEAVRTVPAQRPPSVIPAVAASAPATESLSATAPATAPAAEILPAAAPATALATSSADPAATTAAEDAAALELTRLGLPTHLLPAGGYGEQLHTALRASLTRLPTAPPAVNRPGRVLAVVGPLSLAVVVAREVAHELGLPVATSVALATSGTETADVPERQTLHTTPEAAERRTAWRRRSNLTVVAVDAPLTATGAAEARAFLAALSPSVTWGVVEATRKAQDVGAWTRALGGVHALALTDLEETADPAAVLELGIPVSRLGGRPATARAWATLLTGRLAA